MILFDSTSSPVFPESIISRGTSENDYSYRHTFEQRFGMKQVAFPAEPGLQLSFPRRAGARIIAGMADPQSTGEIGWLREDLRWRCLPPTISRYGMRSIG